MCRDDAIRTDLGRDDPDGVEDKGRNVEPDGDWLPLGEIVSGLLRGWKIDES